MILHDYVRLLRRGGWVVLLFALLGAAGGAALAYTSPPVYFSQATVYASLTGNGTPGDLQNSNIFTVQRASTYADLALTNDVLARASATLGGSVSADDLRGALTSVARTDKALIDITASGSNPSLVQSEANAVADALVTDVVRLDGTSTGPAPVRLSVVQTGELPHTAVAPTPRNDVLIGLLAGLLVGIAVVVVLDALDNRIRTLADLPRREAQLLATLTSIPAVRGRRARAVSGTDVRLESIRHLRANLQFGAQVGSVVAVAGVTGASDADGVARELGAALGEIGSVVVVVDLDLRLGDTGRHRSVDHEPQARPGVADVLSAAMTVDQVLSRGDAEQVYSIPAGNVDQTSAQRLSTPAMRSMVEVLRGRFDYVLLACPPVVDRSESAVAAALAGSSLLVVESGATKRSELLYALELLAGVRVTSVSVAIDHVRDVDLGHTSGELVMGAGSEPAVGNARAAAVVDGAPPPPRRAAYGSGVNGLRLPGRGLQEHERGERDLYGETDYEQTPPGPSSNPGGVG